METIVRLSAPGAERLREAIEATQKRQGTIRVCTGSDEFGVWVKWDNGAGWTPPYYGSEF